MTSRADNTSKQSLESVLQLEPRTEADDQKKPEATRMSVSNAENRTTHERKSSHETDKKRRMLVIAGKFLENTLRDGESVPFDVVAVHGIHGNRGNAWGTDEANHQPGSNWLEQIHKDRPSSRIVTFGYDSRHFASGVYTTERFRDTALQLLDDLVELRRGSDLSARMRRPLVFITHDLGGIIVKMALWIAALENSKYRDIKDSAWTLIFFGCPHRCRSTQEMEDSIARLLLANEIVFPCGIANSIRQLGHSITDINEAFLAFKIPLITNILSVYSNQHENPSKIFDRHTSTLGIPFERRVQCGKSHENMCDIAVGDIVYECINTEIRKAVSPLRGSDDYVKSSQTLWSLAAPIHPIGRFTDTEYHFKWITAHEAYNLWINSQQPSILHIHGTNDTSDTSEYIFRCLDTDREAQHKKDIVTYFTFRTADGQYSSIAAMLNTLLVQILTERPDLYKTVRLPLNEMSRHSSWTQADLLLLFRNVLLNCERGGFVCVLDSMSGCEESCLSSLDDICSLARHTERRFKVVVSGTTNSSLQRVLADWPTINLDSHSEDPHNINSAIVPDLNAEVIELIQHRPIFYHFEKRITEKLVECGQDSQWRRLVVNQLRFSEGPLTNSAAEWQLGVLPPTTPKHSFIRIIANMPLERRRWARNVLIWTLYTFRPLSPSELSATLVLQDETLSHGTRDIGLLVSQDVTGELDEVFKGIFIVKHKEIHFSHPDAREFLQNVNGGRDGAWYDVKETAHQQITAACLFYLSLLQGQKSIETSYFHPLADLLAEKRYVLPNSFSSYAIKYWPKHYKLIPKINRPTESALKFCQNTKAAQIWVQAYWPLWKPIRQIDSIILSPLPILAGLGLQDLVTEWLDPKNQPNYIENCAVALAEAARNAEIEFVSTLLPISGYSLSNLEDVLTAASSCCDQATLDLLIKHVAQRCEYFQWPPVLLCRAAQFGLDNVVQILLQCGASLEAAVTTHGLTPLHLAARHGHVKVTNVLLENKASLTAVDENGLTPLHIASKHSQAAVLSLLLDAHADCNAMDYDGETALDYACKNGSHKVVEMLLTKLACEVGSDKEGKWSPLSTTSYYGFYKCAQLLLEKAAKIEVHETGTGMPLRHAALNGHPQLCQLLLEYGANPNTPFDGDYLLSESVKAGNLEMVKLLIEHGADIDITDSESQNVLQMAAVKGDKALVAYLIDHGADIYHADGDGFTSTHFAAGHGFAEIVQLLIESGADPQHPALNGWTPLHACHAHAETTHVLLKNGVDVNKVTKEGYTPLYIAARSGNHEVLKVLLLYNPELEVTTPEGVSAITAATISGNTEVIRLLLEAGANINKKSGWNNSPLQYAVQQNKPNVLRVLMEYNPRLSLVDDGGNTALHCINSYTSVSVIRVLVNGGADLNIRNKRKETPICRAAWSDNLEVVRYLAKKARLDIVGGTCGGPLHIACYRSRLHLVKFLVDAGADVNLIDPVDGTPLQMACRCAESSKEARDNVIFYLINEANVNVHIVGGLYGSAINAACVRSNSEVVRLMLEKGASVDVEDNMGRTAIHFAATRSIADFELIFESGGDVDVADKIGRTALHWASASGMTYVVSRIISASKELVNQGDKDDWTPLLWAARGCNSTLQKVSSSVQEDTIKLLLDSGADPCVTTKGLDHDWSPVKVARYHGVDSRVIRLLEEKAKEKLKDTQHGWDEEFHKSTEADKKHVWCDCCFAFICGIQYNCKTCWQFHLCYKCYPSREIIHPSAHQFRPVGPEYLSESEESESEEDDEDEGEDD